MAFMFCLGFCANCKKSVTFNPSKVPSIRVNGEKEPLCFECATKWSRLHPEAKFEIDPEAYEPEEVS